MSKSSLFMDYCKTLSFLELIPYLNDSCEWKRVFARNALTLMKPKKKIIDLALLFAQNHNWKLRESAASILMHIGTISSKKKSKFNEIDKATQINNEITSTLIKLAHDQRVLVRILAIFALCSRAKEDLIDPKCIFYLVKEAAFSQNRLLRLWVAMSLPIHIPEEYELLQQLIQDKDEEVRDWAVFAFQFTEYDTPELRELVLNILFNDPDIYTQEEAAKLLIKLKEPKALPMIQDLVYKDNTLNFEILSKMSFYPDESFIPLLESIVPINSKDEENLNDEISELKEKLNKSKPS